MKKPSEGKKMWGSVMLIFLVYAATFMIFEDYDRKFLNPFNEPSDWHLLIFSILVMGGLGYLLLRYAKRMDERIDREQMAKQNEMRRQLTQNIAHELKTPVASILGYTDTILEHGEMDEQTKNQFIARTNAQAKRLTALLHDISTLNRMDYAADMLKMEHVNISEMFADIAEETALNRETGQITLHNCLPEDICIWGNWSLIYSIFRNLTDNAIHYAGRGSIIELSAREQTDCWEFMFADNGVGVSKEHLPRIFERFYRVDKSRSRELGGTGLGLAIVKNAVLLHRGSITATSGKEGGLCFQFSLMKRNKDKRKT